MKAAMNFTSSSSVPAQIISGKLTKEVLNAIKPSHSKPGRFYLLPKIHKIKHPGRPILSGICTVTERISSLVDTLISNIPLTFPSLIEGTSHFLQKIAPLDIPENAFLVTLDVASLYTNIPRRDGIGVVIEAYEHAHHTLDIEGDVLSILMKLVLERNHFEFENRHFLQTNGADMGTKMVPNYASIVMSQLETTFLTERPTQPLFYLRYIDGIFMIWAGTEDELIKFIAAFNLAHP